MDLRIKNWLRKSIKQVENLLWEQTYIDSKTIIFFSVEFLHVNNKMFFWLQWCEDLVLQYEENI